MMQAEQHMTPLAWIQSQAASIAWPVIVVAAFALGRYVRGLEIRVAKLESSIEQLRDRHMPAIHRMLAEIHGLLVGGRH